LLSGSFLLSFNHFALIIEFDFELENVVEPSGDVICRLGALINFLMDEEITF